MPSQATIITFKPPVSIRRGAQVVLILRISKHTLDMDNYLLKRVKFRLDTLRRRYRVYSSDELLPHALKAEAYGRLEEVESLYNFITNKYGGINETSITQETPEGNGQS